MAGQPDFKLVEFQPKMVYLPDQANGTYPRPGSAGDRDRPGETFRGDPSRFHPEPPIREPDYARIHHRGRAEFDSFPRPVDRECRMAYAVEDPKQPLLANPVWVLVPTDAAPQRTAPIESVYTRLDGSPPSDGRGIRRKPVYVREKEEIRRGDKGCCSCWKCAIATIVIMTLLGVGIAVTGIVYINLVILNQNHTVAPESENMVTGTRSGMMDFDIDLRSKNGSRKGKPAVGPLPVILAPNDTAFDVAPDGNSSGVQMDIGDATFDLTNIRTVEVELAPNVSMINISLTQHPSFDVAVNNADPTEFDLYDVGISGSGMNGSNPTALDISAVGINGTSLNGSDPTAFDLFVDMPTTTAVHPLSAFHHPVSVSVGQDLDRVNATVNKVLGQARDALGSEQAKVEQALRQTQANAAVAAAPVSIQGILVNNGSTVAVQNLTASALFLLLVLQFLILHLSSLA